MIERMPDYIKILPEPDYAEIKARPQTQWRGLIALAFYCCGLGAGTYIFSLYYNFVWGMIIGYLINAGIGGLALFFDAGHGFRVWRAVTNFKRAWISRGVVFISCFSTFGFLSIIGHLNLLVSFSTGTPLVTAMDILTVIFGVAIMFYSGFVMSFSASLPFWNSALVPVIFLVYSFLGGLSLLLAVTPFFTAHGLDIHLLEKIELALMLLTFFSIMVYLVNSYGPGSTRFAATKWLRSLLFWIGVVVIGLMIPLLIGFYVFFGITDPTFRIFGLSAVGFLELIGGFIFRFILLDAGHYSPLLSRDRRVR